jgi:hypothetical protein
VTDVLIDAVVGFLTGGLALSAAWGLFWFVISLIGLSRGTCGWPIVLKSLVGGVVPLSLVVAVLWSMGGIERMTPLFGVGLVGMPTVLSGLWLRRMPDGQWAGTHLVTSVRHLIADILGTHQGCGDCRDGYDHKTCR